MYYYVISIQKTTEGNVQAIFAYDSRESALSAYHSTLASNYISETLDGFCVVLINEHGGTEFKEYWDKPIINEIN